MVFTVNGSKVTGHSVTRLSGVNPLYAKIDGRLDKKHHKITFRERVDSDIEACMFDVQLSWFYFNGTYSFNGAFTGWDAHGKYCDEGDMSLTTTYTAGNPFEDERPKQKPAPENPVTEDMTLKRQDTVKAEYFPEIAGGETTQFEWKSDSCTLEIWDGGIIDGDRVTVTFNGSAILSGYVLTAEKKRIALPLTKQKNIIRITAENEGTTPPNTAKVYLWDGRIHHPVLTYLDKGSSAVIEVSKK